MPQLSTLELICEVQHQISTEFNAITLPQRFWTFYIVNYMGVYAFQAFTPYLGFPPNAIVDAIL